MHIVLSTQSLSGSAMLPATTLNQMAVRIALQCADADARLILSSDNGAARLLSRPGEAIYNSAAGLVEGNQPFQVAYLEPDVCQAQLCRIRQWENGSSLPETIIFEGDRPADLAACKPFKELLGCAEILPGKGNACIWLGEPIAILPPVKADLKRQSGRNLLVVARDEGQGVGMLLSAWISLIAQDRSHLAKFYLLDFSTPDSSWSNLPVAIISGLPERCIALNRATLVPFLKEMNDRIKLQSQTEIRTAPPLTPVYFIILGLQRSRDIRKEDGGFRSYNATEPSASDLVGLMLRDGPESGVHVLSWCDTTANATRALGRAGIEDFGIRVGGAMPFEEARDFLNVSSGSEGRFDKPHRAIFVDEEKPGLVQKFIPYAVPDANWLNGIVTSMQRRG
jgi:hypothetical protein